MDIRPDFLNASEVARLLGCSRSYVYKAARAGRLSFLSLGEQGRGRRTAMRFPAEAVAEFIRSRTVPARVTHNNRHNFQTTVRHSRKVTG